MKTAWLTTQELAVALKVSVKTIRRAYLNGEIPVERIFRMVRFDIGNVKEAMRRNGQENLGTHVDKIAAQRATGGASRRRGAKSPRSVKRGRNFQDAPRRKG